jgi:hypothetical protein
MAKKWRNRLLLAKIEAVYGTAPTLAGTDAILISEIDVTPLEVDLKDRELITGVFGNTEKVIGSRMSKATFSVELAGSGTAGTVPKWDPIMRACGFDETVDVGTSVVYDPISTAHESCTLRFYADGIEHTLRGCRGTFSLDLSSGEIPKFQFEFTGLYTAAVAEANPAATFTAQAKPLAINSANTTPVSVHGYAACLESLSLDLANEVIFRQLAGCTENVQITDRKPTGEVSIECPTLAQKDYFSALSTQALGVLEVTHGTTAGNIIKIEMPSINLGGISYADSDGVLMLNMPYMPNPTGAGNNEIKFTLT